MPGGDADGFAPFGAVRDDAQGVRAGLERERQADQRHPAPAVAHDGDAPVAEPGLRPRGAVAESDKGEAARHGGFLRQGVGGQGGEETQSQAGESKEGGIHPDKIVAACLTPDLNLW
ncbi:MAG: hypothetical protein BroJett006_17420 [Betaproteobacteria bacterium]|nr:MAG: hypothetical protein BroJett006_17420 [Betaproteobacteria bacterium]